MRLQGCLLSSLKSLVCLGIILSLPGILYSGGNNLAPGTTPVRAADEDSFYTYFPLMSNDSPQAPVFHESVFGLEMKKIQDKAGLQEVVESGTSFVRLNGIFWAEIEPEEGQRKWEAVSEKEEQLRTAVEENLRVVMIVRQTPAWAQKHEGVSCGPVRSDKLEAFASFMHDLVARYSQPPYYVKYWEIWNEPDVDPELATNFSEGTPFGCWGDPSDEYYGGRYYAEMLKVVYPRMKQADPAAQVMVGGLLMSCNPASGGCTSDRDILASKFFEGVLVNQGGNYFDGVAFHNYDTFQIGRLGAYSSPKWASNWNSTGPALIAKAKFLRDLMETYQVSGKFLMNTETALLCGSTFDAPGGPGCEPDPDSLFEQTKAYYIVHSYAAALAEGLRANIWYSLNGWRNSGLVSTDYIPRPAYTAFQFAREKLQDAVFEAEINSEDTGGKSRFLGYKFGFADGRRVWVIWSEDGNPYDVSLDSPPSGVWDVFGDEVSLSEVAVVNVSVKPLYIEWGP